MADLKHKIGTQFGDLILIRRLPQRKVGKSRKSIWLCRCICGSEKEYQSNNVVCGNSRNCGCRRFGQKPRNIKNSGIANARFVYDGYKRGAKTRKLDFELSFDEFLTLCVGNCYYCGIPPSQIMNVKNIQGIPRLNGEFIYNGIDRVDNDEGYMIENCVPCCRTCNIAKMDMEYEDFLIWIERVHDYQIGGRYYE